MVMKRYNNIGLSRARLRCKYGFQIPHQHHCQTISLSLSSHFSTTQTDTHIQRDRETERERKLFFFPVADNQAAVAWYCICNVFFNAWGYISELKDSEALTQPWSLRCQDYR